MNSLNTIETPDDTSTINQEDAPPDHDTAVKVKEKEADDLPSYSAAIFSESNGIQHHNKV